MTASRNLAEYYHWEETGRGIRIYMHSGMADRLQAEVLRSADGGTEAGGILLGRMEEDRGKPIVVIDGFMPVPCSYCGGPLYTLADEDTPHLEAALLRAALAACESPDAPSVLGYYRSHMRDGLSLSPADLLVIDSYFQAPASLFLLLKTAAGTTACTAGFFFWEDGRIQSEFSSLEVALGRTPALPPPLLPAAGDVQDLDVPDLPDALGDDDLPGELADLFRNASLPEKRMAPAAAPAPEPELSFQPPVAMAPQTTHLGSTPRAWQGLLLRAATISIATLALVISVVTYLGAPRPPREEAAAYTPAPSALGLQVERNPPDLLVTWNRNAREIVTARRATLSIHDGKAESSVSLDKAKLAAGSYLYTAASDDVRFRLEVYGADDGSVAQSIRVSLAGPR
ncbi:MAG TPA: hypothetical protein VN924_20265 [Bryobacteraceae bacterium]|nr:hypothetical protein [Bryobacteraceae bacterium]